MCPHHTTSREWPITQRRTCSSERPRVLSAPEPRLRTVRSCCKPHRGTSPCRTRSRTSSCWTSALPRSASGGSPAAGKATWSSARTEVTCCRSSQPKRRPVAHHKGATRAADLARHRADADQPAIPGTDLASRNAPRQAAAHRFIVRIMCLTCVELWGFEPQTSCMPSAGRTCAGVHPCRSPSQRVHAGLSASGPVAVLSCCTDRGSTPTSA
jgi:hypothetical protein